MIIGINGQIGQYLTQILLDNGREVYGIGRKSRINIDDFSYYSCDLNDTQRLYQILLKIRPNEIYHLAAQTDAVISQNEITETIELNGSVVVKLCEFLHKNLPNTKLFVANSLELFKGSNKSVVSEQDLDFFPANPYGLGKLLAFWSVRYFRERFGSFFCSGLLSTIESPLRRNTYAFRKITAMAKESVDLTVGDIEASRDWLHAYDAANAMFKIINHDTPQDYMITSNTLHTIKELIEQSYAKVGIPFENIRIIKDPNLFRNYEKKSSGIRGDNTRLLSIGWKKHYEFKDIIDDMMK